VVILVGQVPPEREKASIAVAVTADLVERGVAANAVAAPAAKALGGGTAKRAEFVQGGGKNADRVDEALELARAEARTALDGVPAS
jgi:alanyl-tRNA synthetase